jgi:hypothetical protein
MNKPDAPKPDPSKPEAGKPQDAAERAMTTHPGTDPQDFGGREDRPKKKKRKYSRGLRELQTGERRLSKAGARLARAVANGMNTYYKEDKKSSRKKRDGAIRDALKNWARGVGKTMRRSSGVPYDIARAFDTKTIRRNVRAVARVLAPPFFR